MHYVASLALFCFLEEAEEKTKSNTKASEILV